MKGQEQPSARRGWRDVVTIAGGALFAVAFAGISAWQASQGPSLLRPGSFEEFGPIQSGELIMGDIVAVSGATRGRAQGWYDQMIVLPSGKKLAATVREYLPVGEHVWAGYSLSARQDLIRLDTYVRCGKAACPPTMKAKP